VPPEARYSNGVCITSLLSVAEQRREYPTIVADAGSAGGRGSSGETNSAELVGVKLDAIEIGD
jgi:hypothetical protein